MKPKSYFVLLSSECLPRSFFFFWKPEIPNPVLPTINMWPTNVSLVAQGTSLVAQMVKHLPAMRETQVRSLDQEDPPEKEMATHSSTLAWKIPWIEEPSGLQSMGSQRVGHDWVTSLFNVSQLLVTKVPPPSVSWGARQAALLLNSAQRHDFACDSTQAWSLLDVQGISPNISYVGEFSEEGTFWTGVWADTRRGRQSSHPHMDGVAKSVITLSCFLVVTQLKATHQDLEVFSPLSI